MRNTGILAATIALAAMVPALLAQSTPGVISGPVGPSPYDVVRGWHHPFSEPGFTFGGNSGVFAESPNRILIAQRGEFKLPDPIPPAFAGFAGSIGVNVLDFGMNVQDAVDAPRVHHQWQPDKLSLERGISPDTVALLKSRGYDVDYAPGVVLAQVAAIVSDGGWLQGASDGRTAAGKAAGY